MNTIKSTILIWVFVCSVAVKSSAQFALRVGAETFPLQTKNSISKGALLKADTVRIVCLIDSTNEWTEINHVSVIVQPKRGNGKAFYLRSGIFEKVLMDEIKKMEEGALSVLQYKSNQGWIRPRNCQVLIIP